MRLAPVVLAGLLLPMTPADAQVTTNDSALDSLGVPPAAKAPRPAARRPANPAPARPTTSHPSTPAPAKTVKPAIPATPPAILAIPPAVVVPLSHPPPAPTVPLANDAPGTATPIANGMRVTFGTDRADLNPSTAEDLATYARTLVSQNGTGINLFAYATGSPDDPSTPRRLSLQRALAARAVLMKAGIPSARIYPRALGSAGGELPDRVDVTIGAPTPPAAGHAG